MTPVLLAALDRKDLLDNRDLLEGAVTQATKVQLGREETPDHLAREALLVLLVVEVDLDLQDLRDLEDQSDRQDLREHLDHLVCINKHIPLQVCINHSENFQSFSQTVLSAVIS